MGASRDQSLESEGGEGRPIVYCVVPLDLAPALHDLLRGHFADDPGVEVIVERRRTERRRPGERRLAEGEPPAGEERRRLPGATGRRIGERRAALARARPLPLPRRARRHAERLGFVVRREPPSQQLEDLDTARVVARFQAGDRESFSILYSRYFDRVYNYMKVALRDHHEAEDATQQVFAQVLESIDAYERRGRPFRAWLFAIARNHAISSLRRLGRLEPMDPEELNRHREQEGVEEEELPVLDWITDRDLMLFVERLPQEQRQVLVLRFLLDLGNEEIAQVLGRTPNHVRVLQTRALSFLRDRLTAIGREPKSGRRPAMARCPNKARVLRERRFALWN